MYFIHYKIAKEIRIAWEIQISHAFKTDYEVWISDGNSFRFVFYQVSQTRR